MLLMAKEKLTASVHSGAASPEPLNQVRCFREVGEGQGEIDSVPSRQGRGKERPGQGWGRSHCAGSGHQLAPEFFTQYDC